MELLWRSRIGIIVVERVVALPYPQGVHVVIRQEMCPCYGRGRERGEAGHVRASYLPCMCCICGSLSLKEDALTGCPGFDTSGRHQKAFKFDQMLPCVL